MSDQKHRKALFLADLHAFGNPFKPTTVIKRLAGIGTVPVRFRGTDWGELQSPGALTRGEKHVIVPKSYEMTVSNGRI